MTMKLLGLWFVLTVCLGAPATVSATDAVIHSCHNGPPCLSTKQSRVCEFRCTNVGPQTKICLRAGSKTWRGFWLRDRWVCCGGEQVCVTDILLVPCRICCFRCNCGSCCRCGGCCCLGDSGTITAQNPTQGEAAETDVVVIVDSRRNPCCWRNGARPYRPLRGRCCGRRRCR